MKKLSLTRRIARIRKELDTLYNELGWTGDYPIKYEIALADAALSRAHQRAEVQEGTTQIEYASLPTYEP